MNELENKLVYQLNLNGYGFQYSVINYIKSLYDEKKSPWYFEVSEFPVQVNNNSVHIDFILRKTASNFFLLAECKRANPAYSNWCFLKSPFNSRKNLIREPIVREELVFDKTINLPPHTRIGTNHISKDLYRLYFEIKTDNKGESGPGKGQINEAITQIMRGQNGLINYFVSHIENNDNFPIGRTDSFQSSAFFPVIFTTANIFVSDQDISHTDLSTGTLSSLSGDLQEREWIYLQYNQSSNISHSHGGYENTKSLSEALFYESTRTVAIVSAKGLDKFLSQFKNIYEEDWETAKI